MKNKISLFVATCLLSGVVASTVLTPNTNKNSGLIPSGHSDLQFNLSNGNWVQNLNGYLHYMVEISSSSKSSSPPDNSTKVRI